jgi:hypothetical protein
VVAGACNALAFQQGRPAIGEAEFQASTQAQGVRTGIARKCVIIDLLMAQPKIPRWVDGDALLRRLRCCSTRQQGESSQDG